MSSLVPYGVKRLWTRLGPIDVSLTGTPRLGRGNRVSALLPIPRRDLQRITVPAMVLVGERACPRNRAAGLGKQ